ncbi:hypothetical protein LTR74_006505 [Friedmanniomyces endolithicus]|nr:hypothetical protein LTR74_006505 [Friedmanniomyces endolithicus]
MHAKYAHQIHTALQPHDDAPADARAGGLTINDATLRALNVSQSALGAVATATSTVTVTPTAPATSTVTFAPTTLAGDYVSRGVAAGIGAGIGVPLLCALVAVSALLVLEKRRHRTLLRTTDEPATRSGGRDLLEPSSPRSREGDRREEAYHEMGHVKPHELDNQQRLFELANGPR